MRRNYVFKDVNEALPALMGELLDHGDVVTSRAGLTRELPMTSVTLLSPCCREIVLPERKASLPAQIAETMWVLSGRNDIEWLGHYLPRAHLFSDDGVMWRAAYGQRIRRWKGIDQLAYVVETLRAVPDSRQAVISLWDPEVDTAPGLDLPCNGWLHFLNRDGVLDLHVAVRSNDAMWGWSGINAFEWSSLLEVVAGMLRVTPGALHFSISSLHLYDQHWERAEAIRGSDGARDTHRAPRFDATGVTDVVEWDSLCALWFGIEEKIRTGDPAATDHVDAFPEPMLQSWLRVLQWKWTGNTTYLPGGTLAEAALASTPPLPTEPSSAGFVAYVSQLHAEKDAAYRGSWCRRGEMLGIMANIARKVDRLEGGANTSDETSTDTAVDLLVYLAKYRWWLTSEQGAPAPSPLVRSDDANWDVDTVDCLLAHLSRHHVADSDPGNAVAEIVEDFEHLEAAVTSRNPASKLNWVDLLLVKAFQLAQARWLG